MQGNTKFYSLFLSLLLACGALSLTVRAGFSETLTADQIIQKNVEARGGLQAWRTIHTMKLTGKMDAGGKDNYQLPFVLELARPQKSRLEINFAGSTALQIYDGENGWKVRPFLNRVQLEPYTPEEAKIAAEQSDLDGFLIDHDAKDIKVELAGKEQVENLDTYKLKLTMKDGTVRNLWVDAQTFLEVKIDGSPRRLDGKMHDVETYYREYKKISGVTVPFVLETAVEKIRGTHKINFATIILNPVLESDAFSKPDLRGIKPATGLGVQTIPTQFQNEEQPVNTVRQN